MKISTLLILALALAALAYLGLKWHDASEPDESRSAVSSETAE
jgi:hypothetical protein